MHYINSQGRTYITGMNRSDFYKSKNTATHLYDGDFGDPGLPMCKWGWNRDYGESYSIFRGNISSKGICKICQRRADKGLNGVESKWAE